MNTKVDEGKLISGKEALIALANGGEVELQATGDTNWYDSTQWTVGELLCFKGRFRLKPRTIYLNGIEVPAPFEPKDGDTCFILDTEQDRGFYRFTFSENSGIHKNYVYLCAWRTEEEIKQVVAALRQVFGGSHDN